LTSTWTKYSVTGTMAANSNVVKVRLSTPTTTNTMVIWGAQLEVGGPTTTTQITTNLPQGVFLWGIQAPATAPLVTPSSSVVGSPWLPNHAYLSAIYKITSVANASAGSTVYTGVFPNGAGNNLSGSTFTIAGFVTPANNGVFPCTASTNTTITLTNANGVSETNPATATLTLTLTSVQANGTYLGTILGGGSNGWSGYAITVKGFTNPSNNGTFVCTASTGSSLTLMNNSAIAETTTAQALVLGQAVTDSNGNLEVATASGTSGSTTPPWNISPGGTTPDGTQAIFIKQTATASAGVGKSAVATFGTNVTAGDSLVVFVAANLAGGSTLTVSDNQSNAYSFITSSISGPFTSYMYWVSSAAAGATTVTAALTSGQGLWLGVLETSSLASIDAQNTNTAQSVKNGATVFQTGLVPTSTTHDFLVSFAAIIAGNHATSTLSPPANFIPIVSATGVQVSEGQFTIEAAFEFLTATATVNPQWNATFAAGGSREMGITVAFIANSTTTLVWTNFGPIGLTAAIGFTYYYAFMNSETGHVSNVSPLSASTGPIAGQSVTISGLGMQITPSGPYSQDPQVDTIAIFRDVDGGGFWFQLATLANPGTTTAPGTWTYTDTTPSGKLNTAISAPIGLLNSLPPKG